MPAKMNIAIVGAGLSGLSTAYLLGKKFPEAAIAVFEKENVAGGTIGTLYKDGYTLETGPNGFLSSKPSTLKLVAQLGLEGELVKAKEASKKRFVFHQGRLQELPDSPLKFLGSALLSLPAKFRILLEPVIAPRHDNVDETIAEFGRRRLGESAVKILLDPMVSGVFAGHVERLSMASCFPRMIQLEREYGSLVRAMIRLKAKKVSPKGTLLSFKQGMATLISALVKSDTFTLRLEHGVNRITKTRDGYRINEENIPYDTVILACPTHQLTAMEFEQIKPLQPKIAEMVYPCVHVVHFCAPKGSTTGFGFLNPSMENRYSMGALFSDQLFENRAPAEQALVTVLLGGDHHPEALHWSKSEVVDRARNDLMSILNLREDELKLLHVVKWNQSIPQYYVNHRQKVALMESLQKDGLYITGNAWYGVGINDCVQASYNLVEAIGDASCRDDVKPHSSQSSS